MSKQEIAQEITKTENELKEYLTKRDNDRSFSSFYSIMIKSKVGYLNLLYDKQLEQTI